MGFLSSLLFFTPLAWPVAAAERLEVEIDDVVLPVGVRDLGRWVRSSGTDRSELHNWLMLLDQDSRDGLMRLLRAPVLTRRSFGQQMLRSWAAGPLLDALSALIRVEGDRPFSSERVLTTLESLLQESESVSTLDLLEALPSERLRLDLDALVLAASRWRMQLQRHQRLLTFLASSAPVADEQVVTPPLQPGVSMRLARLKAQHRKAALEVQIWTPPVASGAAKRSWVLLMPGLGGDPEHFQWLARALAAAGWPVAVLEHPGSDAAAVQALLEGRLPFAGAEALRERLQDLDTVLEAQRSGVLPVDGEQVILVGHSLGALTALLATGVIPVNGLDERCREALGDLPLTNLSHLLQCELAAGGVLKGLDPPSDVRAVVGLNSFGSLIWPSSRGGRVRQPLMLMGGTLDLITPPLHEQLALLQALGEHPASRAVIVEGASHFSPIRVEGQSGSDQGDDLFQLGEELVGVQPLAVQQLLTQELITFLEQVESAQSMGPSQHFRTDAIRWHRLNRGDAGRLLRSIQ